MNLRYIFSFLVSTLCVSFALASGWSEDCPNRVEIVNNTVISQLKTMSIGCALQITPKDKPGMHYKDYWFDERGRFLVFVSKDTGPSKTSVGMRSFFVFPRLSIPTATIVDSYLIQVTHSSGHQFYFDSITSQLLDISDMQFTFDPKVNFENRGGVELTPKIGFIIDTGWSVGNTSYKNPHGKALLKQSTGPQCDYLNSDFFFYYNTYYGEPNFKFATDSELSEFISSSCH